MTHQPLPLDAVLLIIAIGAYVVAALALTVYFFSREEWLKHLGVPLAIAGCVAQFAQLIARYEITHIWPLLNLYGSLSLFAALSVAIFIGFAFKYDLWFAGGLVLTLAAGFLAYGATWNEGTLPAVPSLQSYWAKIHVPLVVSSYSAFMVAFSISVVYLIKHYAEESRGGRKFTFAGAAADIGGGSVRNAMTFQAASPAAEPMTTPNLQSTAAAGDVVAQWLATIPSLAQLDILIYRAVAVGLPLLTLGIITGAMWAHEAWGAYWQWDPKETAALFSWIVFAIYMHLHTRREWRGVRSAWLAAIGFLTILFCYFGVNIWISGLHSYKL